QQALIDVDVAQAGGAEIGEPDFVGVGFGESEVVAGERRRRIGANVPATGAAESGVASQGDEAQGIGLGGGAAIDERRTSRARALDRKRFGAEVERVDVERRAGGYGRAGLG